MEWIYVLEILFKVQVAELELGSISSRAQYKHFETKSSTNSVNPRVQRVLHAFVKNSYFFYPSLSLSLIKSSSFIVFFDSQGETQ